MQGKLTTADLREKVVININGGKKLGYICDFGVDVCGGCLTSLIIRGEAGLLGARRCSDIVIGWERIQCIGEDAILVDVPGSCKTDCAAEVSCRRKSIICRLLDL